MSSDPHQGGDLFDMAKDGTSIPNDAGKMNIIPSVPRPDQINDSPNDLGAAGLSSAADNPIDISRVRPSRIPKALLLPTHTLYLKTLLTDISHF